MPKNNNHNEKSQYHITYTFSSLKYFFSFSQWIDYQIGKSLKLSLQSILSDLQLNNFHIKSLFALFSYLFTQQQNTFNFKQQGTKSIPAQTTNEIYSQSQTFNCKYFTLNSQHAKKVLQNDGLRLIYSQILLTLNRLQGTYRLSQVSQQITIDQQMMFKILINIFYILIYWIQKQNYFQEKKENKPNNEMKGSPFLNSFYKQVQIDNFLIRLLTLSLEAHFIPIKKITMLYTKVLSNLFSYQTQNGTDKIFIHPIFIFDDKVIQSLPVDNTLDQNYLQRLKQKNPPLNQSVRNVKAQPVQQFYRRHNMGDCPLAQSIVVGLLRSLLTICNSQNHKKFTTVKGAGVDSFRQWQISYRFAIQNINWVQKLCSEQVLQRIKSYQQFDKNTTEKSQPNKQNLIFHEFYVHKIYTTSVITNFFMLILLGLKLNVFIQYLYFLQLISDANGILVFLKFLTDKFQFLEHVQADQFVFVQKQQYNQKPKIQFKDKVMLTVYSILNMLHSSCNNYPQKVKNYLFQYNSYLIIKKIPVLFFPELKSKNKAINQKKKEQNQAKKDESQMKKQDLQGSLPNLPSKQQLEQLMNKKQSNNQNRTVQQAPLVIRNLTQTCYQLLKVQIPYFSKKMKDTNNMKMLIDIYCRFPKTVTPIKRTTLQKLQLKFKSKKNAMNSHNKPIISIQQMKNIHNQYNNLYYWSNDFVIQLQGNKAKNVQTNINGQKTENNKKGQVQTQKMHGNILTNSDFDYEEWLQQNIWKYYD